MKTKEENNIIEIKVYAVHGLDMEFGYDLALYDNIEAAEKHLKDIKRRINLYYKTNDFNFLYYDPNSCMDSIDPSDKFSVVERRIKIKKKFSYGDK